MTSRGALLAVLAVLLLVAGLLTLNGSMIALALPLLVHLGFGLYRRTERVQVRASRSLSVERTSVGAPVAVTLTVTNDGPPLSEVRIEDVVARGLRVVEGETRVLASLATGTSIAVEYTVCGTRGSYRFQHTHVTAVDGFDLFERQGFVHAPGALLVHPDATRLRPIEIRPPRTRGFAGPIPARQGGSGLDFFTLREYQMGDRLRWVNWRVTARTDQVFSNVFEQERIADVGLILDARQHNDVRIANESLFEHAIGAAASLAETFLSDGNRVGLLVYGASLDGVFPGYGHVQRDRIMRALGRASAGHHFVFESLKNLPTRFFPAQSQIVFIGPVSAGDVPTLIRLRAQGYAILAVCPNPIAFEARAHARQPRVEYAMRVAQAERDFNLGQLRGFGVQVVDWDVQLPLEPVLQAAMARQPVQRRPLARVR
jgi:uncharacterized protein (DUF58 family)